MDPINKAYVLELSYRLTVAVNMSVHNLESISWMKAWNSGIFNCAQSWHTHLLDSIVDNKNDTRIIIQTVNDIVDGLERGYLSLAGTQPSQDAHAYHHLLNKLLTISHAPIIADWGLPEVFTLGQQLARNDLRAHFAAIDKPEIAVVVASPFVPLSKSDFPRSWSKWPSEAAFNDHLARYVGNRREFAGHDVFEMGALVSFMQSALCPARLPSTVWTWQDWEGGGSWRLYLAGRLFSSPTLVTVKDKNDRAFVGLLEAMDRDKKTGRAASECGWVTNRGLWPEKRDFDARGKAWTKLTTKTLAVMGKFQNKGGAGKYKGIGAPCRLPAEFAEPDCRIFIERLK